MSTALALSTETDGAGTLALALMPDDEFAQRLDALKKGAARIRQIKKDLMQEGSHYGVIPNTDKPTLLKPGAEVLLSIYSLRADFKPQVDFGDGATSPAIRVLMRCELHHGNLAGPVVGVGYGTANSWERKHRYRRGERTCPTCGVVGSVIKGKADYGGGWLCWRNKGGCGAKWADGAQEIETQAVNDVENPDQHDLENTLVKMAEKRALTDATLRATASSDLFTQDVDDDPPPHSDGPDKTATKGAAPRGVPRLDPCPDCKKVSDVMLSKQPGNGKFYCRACRLPFGPPDDASA